MEVSKTLQQTNNSFPGSTAGIVKPGEGHIVALAMVNTILCGAWAALTFLIIHYLTKGKWTLLLTLNACLAGE